MPTLRLAVIGAGLHATGQHLPALREHARRHPHSVELIAVCDRDPARAAAAAGGARAYDDWRRCLDAERPDAVLVCLPPALTPEVAIAAAAAGAAVWTEKPLAADLAGARALVDRLAGARAMASMNRRHEPTTLRLRELVAGRTPRLLRATMARSNRREPDFLTATGVHVVDLAMHLAEPPAGPVGGSAWERAGARWARITWTSTAGCEVCVDIMPTLGHTMECVEMVGDGWRGEARSAWFDAGCIDWRESGQPARREQIDMTAPEWVRNGTAAETAAFVAACAGQGPWSPPAAEVLAATAACHAIAG